MIGIDRNGYHEILLANQSSSSFVNLNSINAYRYPYINFLSKIFIDTITGYQSSVLNSLKVNYNTPAEIVLDKRSLYLSDTVVRIGNELDFSFDYHNAGYTSNQGFIVNIYKSTVNQSNLIKSDTLTDVLKVDSLRNYHRKFTVPYFKPASDSKLPIYIELLPQVQNEFYVYNDYINFHLILKEGSRSFGVDLYSDGQLIKSGDYVRSKPELKINITIPGEDNLNDTSQVALRLNDLYVPYFKDKGANSELKFSEAIEKDAKSENVNSIIYFPTLKKGINKLSLVFTNGVNSDSVNYDLMVSDQLLVKELYNFPNPMREETNFVFNLLGVDTPKNCKIRIYTTAGRLIREINIPANIGYNQIQWNGRDSDGDEIANGTYLYKIVTEDNSKSETAIQKLVVLK